MGEATVLLPDGTVITVPAENIGSDRLGFTFANEIAKGKVSISLRLKANVNTNAASVACNPVAPVTPSPIMSPTPVPTSSCIICTNVVSSDMKKKGYECTDKKKAKKKKKKKSNSKKKKKICQLSCYNAGKGYEGDIC